MIIIEREMFRVISRASSDMTPSSDEIINRLIKACSGTLTKLLISLFQICVTHAYHSIVFKTANIIILRKTRKVDYIISKAYRLIVLLNIIEKNHEVDYEQENLMTCEDSSTIARITYGCSVRQVNENCTETANGTDTHRVKTEQRSSGHLAESECGRSV